MIQILNIAVLVMFNCAAIPGGATGRTASKVLKGVISSAHAPIRETHSLWGLIFSARNIVPVLLKEDTFVLPSGGGRDIIIIFLQTIDDFFGGLLIRLFAFRVKVGQYLVQTINPDLYTIRKSQYAPTNCWRFRFASCHSSFHFRL